MRGQPESSPEFSTDSNPNRDERSSSSSRLLTVKEVSDRLRLSQAKVYALINSGDLESYRFGRSIRVSDEQVERYLKQSMEVTTRLPRTGSCHF